MTNLTIKKVLFLVDVQFAHRMLEEEHQPEMLQQRLH
jgi:hypothetical protein